MQGARESARRTQCVNNLKQLGLAVSNYASNVGVLPPTATTSPSGFPSQPTNNFGMKARILPYLEQSLIFDALNQSDFALSATGENDTIVTTQVSAYLCPSDTNVPAGPYTFVNGTASPTSSAMAAIPTTSGPSTPTTAAKWMVPPIRSGAHGTGGSITLAKISDGLSNTAVFSE